MSAAFASLLQRRVRTQSIVDYRQLFTFVYSSKCGRIDAIRMRSSNVIRFVTTNRSSSSKQHQHKSTYSNKPIELELGANKILVDVKRKRRIEWSGSAIAMLVCLIIVSCTYYRFCFLVITVDGIRTRLLAGVATTLETWSNWKILCKSWWTGSTVSSR